MTFPEGGWSKNPFYEVQVQVLTGPILQRLNIVKIVQIMVQFFMDRTMEPLREGSSDCHVSGLSA